MKKKFSLMLALCVVAVSALSFTACGKVDEYALSAYKGEKKDADGNIVYNTSLFYSNAVQQGYPDPQVLDDTEQSGKYYLYGTSGNAFGKSCGMGTRRSDFSERQTGRGRNQVN